jgi:hypothetical protein
LHLCASFIRSSNGSGIVLWSVIGLCAGLYLFYRGFQLLQRRRLILDTPFSKLRSASLGLIEVSGLALGPYTMTAPITSRPCYYYRTLVWEYKQRGKNKQWVKVAAESMHLPFFLDDNTGRVLVDPRQAELDLHCDFEQEFCDSFFTVKQPTPDNVCSFLARRGIATSNKIKVEEYCIKPKNALFILGTIAENPDIEVAPNPIPDRDADGAVSLFPGFSPGFSLKISASPELAESDEEYRLRDRFATATAPQVIRLSPAAGPAQSAAMSQQEKIAAAMTKAGIVNPAAWAAAGLSNTSVAVSESSVLTDAATPGAPAAKAEAFDQHPPVVLTKGANNKAFMISWRSQRDVARSLAWKCTLMIWGGPALSLLCLYILLNSLRLL